MCLTLRTYMASTACPSCPYPMGGTVLGTPMHVSHLTYVHGLYCMSVLSPSNGDSYACVSPYVACRACPSHPFGMGGTVLGIHTTVVYPMSPSCPTVPCGVNRRDSPRDSPMCPSRPSVPCGVNRRDSPRDSPMCRSIPSLCFNRRDFPRDSRMCPYRPSVSCGVNRRDSRRDSPMCPSRPSVLCGVNRRDSPRDSHYMTHVSIPSLCSMWGQQEGLF